MGLRARKKAATADRIIKEAVALFHSAGYEAARIEDIAAKAELSAQTFYNYFPSKADVLIASIVAESEAVLAEGERCIGRRYASAAAGFDALNAIYFRSSFSATSRDMWRIAMARVISSANSEFSRRYLAIDSRFALQVRRFVTKMQQSQLICASIDAAPLGDLLFNTINMNFLRYVQNDSLSASAIEQIVQRQIAPAFKMVEPRKPVLELNPEV